MKYLCVSPQKEEGSGRIFDLNVEIVTFEDSCLLRAQLLHDEIDDAKRLCLTVSGAERLSIQ